MKFVRKTAPGAGGLAVFRLFGDDCGSLLTQSGFAKLPRTERIKVGNLIGPEGILDEVLVSSISQDPAVFDVGSHAGPAVVEAIEKHFEQLGATQLSPDEYLAQFGASELQRQAQHCLPQCRTATATRVLMNALNGSLDQEIARIRELLRSNSKSAGTELTTLVNKTTRALQLFNPVTVALIGRPNAGKSTLFNKLVGSDRVIVSDQAGTTRDEVDDIAFFDQFPVQLFDTAGVRNARDAIESEGVELALKRQQNVCFRLFVIDGSQLKSELQGELLSAIAANVEASLLVINKTDVAETAQTSVLREILDDHNLGNLTIQRISALTGQGVSELKERVVAKLFSGPWREDETIACFTRDQLQQLKTIQGCVNANELEHAATKLKNFPVILS